jgi:nucleoside recognition membrane protein YjiH
MMLSLAHMTPLLFPSYWVVFAVGLAVGVFLGYRLGLSRQVEVSRQVKLAQTAPIQKNRR